MTGDDLRRVLKLADKVVPKKTTLPILGTVSLRRQGKRVEIQATNLDLSFRVWVDGTGPENCCIELKKLLGAVELERAGEIQPWKKHGIQVGGIRLEGMNPEDFPVLPKWPAEGEEPAAMCCAEDLQVAREVARATSADEAWPSLHYVLLEETAAHALKAIGTNGHVMYVAELQGSAVSKLTKSCLVHPWALNLVVLCCDAFGTEVVNVWVRTGKKRERSEILFEGGVWSVCCKVDNDITFPDYRQAIERKGKSVRLDVAPFIAAFGKALMVYRKFVGLSAAPYCVVWYPHKGILRKAIADVGEFEFEVPVVEPEVTAVGFDAAYMTEALRFVAPTGEGAVLFKQKDNVGAGILRCGLRLALLMPVRLGESDLEWPSAQEETQEEPTVATG